MKNIIHRHTIVFFVCLLFLFLQQHFGFTCIIKSMFGVICPACGMTRAMLALLKMDINTYMQYNPMTFPVALSVILIVHRKKFLKFKKIIEVLSFVIIGMNFIYWIYKIF